MPCKGCIVDSCHFFFSNKQKLYRSKSVPPALPTRGRSSQTPGPLGKSQKTCTPQKLESVQHNLLADSRLAGRGGSSGGSAVPGCHEAAVRETVIAIANGTDPDSLAHNSLGRIECGKLNREAYVASVSRWFFIDS